MKRDGQRMRPDGEWRPLLDWFRIAAAVLVIAIHTSPLAGINGTADFILTRILARLAVPFFFSVTGYFLFGAKREPDGRRVLRFCCRTGMLYLACIFLYLPLNLYSGSGEGLTAAGLLADLLVDGTFYHLWYLPAAITGVLLVWGFLRLGRGSVLPAFLISGVLYLIGLGGDSYYGLVTELPAMKGFYDRLFQVAEYTRNGFFFAPLFLVLGAAARRHMENRRQKERMAEETAKTGSVRGREDVHMGGLCSIPGITAGLAVCAALLLTEGLLLHQFEMQRHDSMYLLLVPASWFLLLALVSGNRGQDRQARRLSMLLYVLHPWGIVLVRGFAKVTKLTGLLVANSMVHFLAVCAVSFLLCLAVSRVLDGRMKGGKKTAGREPAEQKPTEQKPAEQKPTEQKPAGGKTEDGEGCV